MNESAVNTAPGFHANEGLGIEERARSDRQFCRQVARVVRKEYESLHLLAFDILHNCQHTGDLAGALLGPNRYPDMLAI